MNWAVLLPLEHGIIAMSILRFCCCLELNASWIVDQQTCETLSYFCSCGTMSFTWFWEKLSLGQQIDKRTVSVGDCQLSPVQNFLSVVEPFRCSLLSALQSIQHVTPDRRHLSSPSSYWSVPRLVKILNSFDGFKLVEATKKTAGRSETGIPVPFILILMLVFETVLKSVLISSSPSCWSCASCIVMNPRVVNSESSLTSKFDFIQG